MFDSSLDNFEKMVLKQDKVTPWDLTDEEKGNAEKLISNKYPSAGIGSVLPFLNNAKKGILSFFARSIHKVKKEATPILIHLTCDKSKNIPFS